MELSWVFWASNWFPWKLDWFVSFPFFPKRHGGVEMVEAKLPAAPRCFFHLGALSWTNAEHDCTMAHGSRNETDQIAPKRLPNQQHYTTLTVIKYHQMSKLLGENWVACQTATGTPLQEGSRSPAVDGHCPSCTFKTSSSISWGEANLMRAWPGWNLQICNCWTVEPQLLSYLPCSLFVKYWKQAG